MAHKYSNSFNANGLVKASVRTFDGLTLQAFTAGAADRPPLLLVNAVGLNVSLVAPLARALAKSYRFITWDARMSPGPEGDPLSTDCSPDAYVRDISSVMEHFEIPKAAAVLGWCSGVESALRFAHAHPERLGAVVLISPAVRGLGKESETSIRNTKIYRRIMRQPEMADVITRVMNPAHSAPELLQAHNRTTSAEIALHLAAPFGSPEALRRQSAAITGLYRSDLPVVDPSRRLRVPLLVLTGTHDQVVDPGIGYELARAQVDAVVHCDPQGDHYIACAPESIMGPLADFLSARDLGRSVTGATHSARTHA